MSRLDSEGGNHPMGEPVGNGVHVQECPACPCPALGAFFSCPDGAEKPELVGRAAHGDRTTGRARWGRGRPEALWAGTSIRGSILIQNFFETSWPGPTFRKEP